MHKTAGMFFLLGGSTILMGIITAEIYFPGVYSISQNMISNLGATRPPDSIIHQPAADIFDYSMLTAGILILIGSFFLHKALPKRPVVLATTLVGLGTFGVGIFPAFHLYAHPISAFLTFSSGGVAAILSTRVTKKPFALLALILGTTSLTFLFLGVVFPHIIVPVLGAGGTERWVAYPTVLWLTSFGGYLMNTQAAQKQKK